MTGLKIYADFGLNYEFNKHLVQVRNAVCAHMLNDVLTSSKKTKKKALEK